jgi:hypothetical protein
METTNVRVVLLTDEEAKQLLDAQVLEKLGDRKLETMTLTFIAEMMPGNRKFLVEWEGSDESRALSGVKVGDNEIGSLQNTLVRSMAGDPIGSCEQLARYAGDSGSLQRVLITLF